MEGSEGTSIVLPIGKPVGGLLTIPGVLGVSGERWLMLLWVKLPL